MTVKTLIIGGGISGLACGYFARKPYQIFEKENVPGGLCRSVRFGGFTFDNAGHFIHARDPQNIALLRNLLGKNLAKVSRNAWIYAYSSHIPFPFQSNLFALPPKIRQECLKEFLNKINDPDADKNFLRWSLSTYGKGITRHFMKPYNEKLWTVKADSLMTDWVAPFVPNPKPEEIINGAKKFNRSNIGYNAHFYYPRTGGCSAFVNALAKRVKNLNLNISAQKIDYKRRILHTSDSKQRQYTNLISTQPLPELLRQMTGLPDKIKTASGKLSWNSILCLNISVKTKLADKSRHWVYFPEKKYAFYRAGVYTNIMPSMAPKGWRSFYVEFSYKPGKKPDEEQLIASVKHSLIEAGLIAFTDSLDVVNPIYMPYAYVIYDRNRKAAVETIHEFLRKHNIYSIGRYGAWKYSFIEESISDARNLMAML